MKSIYKPIRSEVKKEDLEKNSIRRSDALEILGISKSSFYKLLRHKILRTYKGGTNISKESFNEVLKYIQDSRKMYDGDVKIEPMVRFWKMKGWDV